MAFEISHYTKLLCQVSANSVDHNFWPSEHFLRQWHLVLYSLLDFAASCLLTAVIRYFAVHWHDRNTPRCATRNVHESELYSKIVHRLLATKFLIWPNSNAQKNYQANSKTINRINENCLSVQVLPSSKLFWLICFNTRVFNLGPCKFPSHFTQSGLEWVP